MATTHCQIKAKLTGERNMQFAASSRYTPLHPIAAGIAISALVAGAGGALASDCGDLAGKVFGDHGFTAFQPRRQGPSNAGGDQGAILPGGGRYQAVRRFRYQVRGLAST